MSSVRPLDRPRWDTMMRRLATLLPLALFLAMPAAIPASVMAAPPLG